MKFAIVIVGLGTWLVLDGLYSIFKYRKQTLQKHLIGVLRAGVDARAERMSTYRILLENGQTKRLGDQGAYRTQKVK